MLGKIFLVLLVLGISVAYAQNLTITIAQNTTPSFVNTRTNLSVLNFTVVSDNAHVNITGLNVTFRGTANGTDIAKAFVFNASTSGLLLGSNTSISPNLTTDQNITVSFSTPLLLPNRNQTVIVVVYEIATNAIRNRTVGGEIESAGALSANHTVVANVSLPNSTVSAIRNLHYNTSISPRIVDTSVDNQTFIYTLTPTGGDNASTILINIPSGFTNLSIINVTRGASAANLTAGVTTSFTSALLNVTFDTASNERVEVYFKANTSSTPQSSVAINSSVYGGDLANVSTDAVFGNLTNVTTTNIINRTTIGVSKGVAIVNGSDFWEFNFTVNFNVSITGTLHFKMTNWTDEKNNTITLSTCTPSCATLRLDINASLNTSKINITNAFDPNYGITMSPVAGNLTTLYLRSIIPLGSSISSTWFATYTLLFRATP